MLNRNGMCCRRVFVLFLVLIALHASSIAQACIFTPSLFVTVWDPVSGNPVENATVKLTGMATGVTQNVDGVYAFPAVLPGSYTITVTSPCYPTRSQFVTVDCGQIESATVGLQRYALPSPKHKADVNADSVISLSEYMRVNQLYNASNYRCQAGTEDGYAPGAGSTSCTKHTADYSTPFWKLSLSELLRVIQLYNAPGYHKQSGTEDGYAPNCYS